MSRPGAGMVGTVVRVMVMLTLPPARILLVLGLGLAVRPGRRPALVAGVEGARIALR